MWKTPSQLLFQECKVFDKKFFRTKNKVLHAGECFFPFLAKGRLCPCMVEDCDFGGVFWVDYWKVGKNEVKTRGDTIIVSSEPCMLCLIGSVSNIDEIVILYDFV